VKDLHRGVDIGLPAGTEICSAQDGKVTFAGNSGDYGNVVVIGNEKGIVTKYAHCESIFVSVGQSVNMGDIIATVGNTGNSTGPHLHFEILAANQYRNSMYFAGTGG
jgi:murein DD-endopeptidase MepM/ murein hydrolase activator NlpD